MSIPPQNFSFLPPQICVPSQTRAVVHSLHTQSSVYNYLPPPVPIVQSRNGLPSYYPTETLPPMSFPPPNIPPTSHYVPPPYPPGPVQATTSYCYHGDPSYVNLTTSNSDNQYNVHSWNKDKSYVVRSQSTDGKSNSWHSTDLSEAIQNMSKHEKHSTKSHYYDRELSRSQYSPSRESSRSRYSPSRESSRSRYSPSRESSRSRYSPSRESSRSRYSPARSSSRSWYSPTREKYERERRDYRSTSDRSIRSPSYSSHNRVSRGRDERYYRERYHIEDRKEYERRKYYERSSSHQYEKDYRSHSQRYTSRDDDQYIERHSSHRSRSPSRTSTGHKSMTDREKILDDYRRNYCSTSEDFIRKMEKWSKEHKSDEEENTKMWYRSSPAELYYRSIDNGIGMEQTQKLEKVCEKFFNTLIERGRKARPEVDELPPLKAQKAKRCKHNDDHSSSSSSSEDEDCLDEKNLQGYTDRMMMELERKQSHPRRLHPELWYNNTGEMNAGPLCRCSAKARRHGIRHGVYADELHFPKCIPNRSNIDKLYHYRITVSPPTNFLIKSPTIISHDEHEFLFSGFSMFSHYKLAKLPTCKVIRFNIEYTILYVEEPTPQNFTIKELDLFEEFLFKEILELVDLDLGVGSETTCSQFHFMPRFVRYLPDGGCEVLSMCEILKYLINESGLLIPPESLEKIHNMDHYHWQKYVDRIKGMIVTYPGKKPCSVRVDQIDKSPPLHVTNYKDYKNYYPEIVHFGIRPPQLSYAGNPEYQKAWRYYVKYRHLIANMAKPMYNDRQKLAAKEARLQEMRTQSKMKRDVTVAISSKGFHTTGLMCDVVQHAMLIPVLVRHLRFHKSLERLEETIQYKFKQRALLQTALTHPSYRENFGTNPDHARNTLANCGIRQPEYGDRRIHYTRKKGIVTLINIMSRFGKSNETESEIKHNERLEFLGDAVVEFISSIHLFKMFPGLAEGGLATYRAAIVQNQHLALLAKNIGLDQYMLYAHGSDLCRDVVMRHAMANCFEALMGALFLDAGLQVTDRVFAMALWHGDDTLYDVWMKERAHTLQDQEPLGDRQYIKDFEFLRKLTEFEDSIGVKFKHIRLLARAFTDRSVGFTNLTLGSNQRLEFLGDTVLQLVVSDKLYKHFPDHHEGHLSLLRSSLVNNRTQAMVCDDLNMSEYAIYNNPKAKPTAKKHKADLLEAFLGALYIDKNLEYCQVFCSVCLFPRLQEFIMNQDWNDPKSKLQQCCLTLRSMQGGEPQIPFYKVIECLGPTNTRLYTVGVYFRGKRLSSGRGHSIQEAEMNAAETALATAHELFPQLDHQKRIIAKSMRRKRKKAKNIQGVDKSANDLFLRRDEVPKAYRPGTKLEQSSESDAELSDTEEPKEKKSDDESDSKSGSDCDSGSGTDKFENVQVSSLVSDMERLKQDLINRNEYDKLKEKCKKSDSDEEL
ncbi:ribonuclease 3 isoform X2 [Leptidea sinapis]|uniref:ribonuclease 3 isoform X2 n=1 Tax=Leptidea sinapis TaxID=189913 RepID=UPI0021C3EAF1|nr:ribonuclease 3 isoform X2 [Leptidea sinapis]